MPRYRVRASFAASSEIVIEAEDEDEAEEFWDHNLKEELALENLEVLECKIEKEKDDV